MKGDARAFDSLVCGYSGLVFSTCKRILQNDASAEDATQECFLQLAHKKPKIKTSLGAWLHAVATNKSISRIREESRRRKREQLYAESGDAAVEAEWDDIQDFVDEAIESIPDDLRQCVVASFLQRKTHGVIAEEYGVDRSTITRRIDRGVEKIRKHLKQKGVITSSAPLGTMLTENMLEAVPGGLEASLSKIALAGGNIKVTGNVAGKSAIAGMPIIPITVLVVAILAGVWYFTSRDSANLPTNELASETAQETDPELELTDDVEPVPLADDTNSPDLEPPTTPLRARMQPVPEDEPVVGTTVSGRVYDVATGKGLEGVTIRVLDLEDLIKFRKDQIPETIESPDGESIRVRGTYIPPGSISAVTTTVTGEKGLFSVPSLSEGEYQFLASEMEGYPGTGTGFDGLPVSGIEEKVSVAPNSKTEINVNIALNPGGTMMGTVLLGGKPLRGRTIRINTFPSSGRDLGTLSTVTDQDGRYQITGLLGFKGSMIAMRTQDNGLTQDALVVPAEIEPGKILKVDFDFIAGSATIEGTVFYQNIDTPIQASLSVYFGWEVDGEYKEEVIRAKTDENGFFIAEGLPTGNAEIHIFPKGVGEGIRRIESVVLSAGQRAFKDIVISSAIVKSHVANIPSGTKELFIVAIPGEVDVKMSTVADFMAMRDAMAAVSQNYPGASTEMWTELKGLQPGRYTIHVAAWPAQYTLAAVQAYGMKKFFEDIRIINQFITVSKDDTEIEFLYDFGAP
jgi:RNA polymerase sigma-70 factor (ECF subfamily)